MSFAKPAFLTTTVFTKLASQLSAEKLSDLAIIPAIFIIQMCVSWCVSWVCAKVFRLNRRASNFVTAMGVFGNSNSLPISLVISLSQTIKGLHWAKIPGDNDDEVGARGILYLLIFQQLGQLVRWSWGYHVLLAPKEKYPEYRDEIAEEGNYRDEPEGNGRQNQRAPLIDVLDGETADEFEADSNDSQVYEPAGRTPVASRSHTSLAEAITPEFPPVKSLAQNPTALGGNHPILNGSDIMSFPSIRTHASEGGIRNLPARILQATGRVLGAWKQKASEAIAHVYEQLPEPLQGACQRIHDVSVKFRKFLWEFMNPPLWAMLIAVLVASVPSLQRLFFEEGSFVANSVTSAVRSSGNVAVPLILVVLGANLARNTMAREDSEETIDPEEEKLGNKILVASLLSRMLLPTVIMAPILALLARYMTVSILDDPIFVIVCFLLTGAPSALQLAQICQINNVFEKTMGRILFQSYVIW